MPVPPVDPSVRAPQLVQTVENVLPIDEIFPVQALLLGGGVLVGIVFLHAFLMRRVMSSVSAGEQRIRRAPAEWRIDLVMVTAVFGLLAAGLLEVVAWTAAMKYARLFPSWASAAAYAATTYTTLGDVTRAPPAGWRMLGPIIAISGLFTFGWSGSVLVDVVGRLGRLRDLVRSPSSPAPPPPAA